MARAFAVHKPYRPIAMVALVAAPAALWGFYNGFGLFAAIPLALLLASLYAVATLARRPYAVVVRDDGIEIPERPIADPLFVPWQDVGTIMIAPAEPEPPRLVLLCHIDDVKKTPEGERPPVRWRIRASSLVRPELPALRDAAVTAWRSHHGLEEPE